MSTYGEFAIINEHIQPFEFERFTVFNLESFDFISPFEFRMRFLLNPGILEK